MPLLLLSKRAVFVHRAIDKSVLAIICLMSICINLIGDSGLKIVHSPFDPFSYYRPTKYSTFQGTWLKMNLQIYILVVAKDNLNFFSIFVV